MLKITVFFPKRSGENVPFQLRETKNIHIICMTDILANEKIFECGQGM